VLAAQFYLLRALGASFERTAWLLALLNLPALWLVVRRARGARRPDARAMLLWGAMLLLPALYLGTWMHDPQFRGNYGHAWLHSDIIYVMANGELRPEEPQLAGVRLSYPWLGHVQQGVVSVLLDAPPNSTYLLANVACLLAVIVLVAELVARLGGGRVAQVAAVAWLCFAVNVVGAVARRVLPSNVRRAYDIWGDPRYAPWIKKFAFFQQTVLGIALFAALAYALTRPDDEGSDPAWLALVALLLVASAVLYPVLFPACAALVGARLLVLTARRWRGRGVARARELAGLAAALVVAAAAAAAYVALVNADRGGAPTVGLSAAGTMGRKAVNLTIVLAPLLAGLAVAWRALRRAEPDAVAVLALGALASVVLNVAFSVYYFSNEYKFVFTAAICLAPFPVMAMARRVHGRAAAAGALAVALLLALPQFPRPRDRELAPAAPRLDVSGFALRLDPRQELAGVTDAIRDRTSPGAVLVSRALPFDLVAVTRRPLFVPHGTGLLHGTALGSDYLLKNSRGYAVRLVDGRRRRVRALYEATTEWDRERQLGGIVREVGRPVVLLVRRREDAALGAWLAGWPAARPVFSSDAVAAWQVDSVPAARVIASAPRH
jgi:hypothetical protein